MADGDDAGSGKTDRIGAKYTPRGALGPVLHGVADPENTGAAAPAAHLERRTKDGPVVRGGLDSDGLSGPGPFPEDRRHRRGRSARHTRLTHLAGKILRIIPIAWSDRRASPCAGRAGRRRWRPLSAIRWPGGGG